MNPSPKLAVAITTKDNMRTIAECLDSLDGLGARLLVVDSGSSDGTIELCRARGAEVVHQPWMGMVKQRQFSIDACHDAEWVLSLDSDESLDAELVAGIRAAVEEAPPAVAGYRFNRKVWYRGAWLHHVFQPEPRLRLVRRGRARVHGIGPEGKGGHDYLVVDGEVRELPGTCKHDSWADMREMLTRYLQLGARAAEYDPKPSSLPKLLFSPVNAFVKQYLLKGGFRDGRRGLLVCLAFACGTLMKHLLKCEAQWFGPRRVG